MITENQLLPCAFQVTSHLFVNSPLTKFQSTATYSSSVSSSLHSDLNYYATLNEVNFASANRDKRRDYFSKTDNNDELIDIRLRNGCTIPSLGLGTSHSGGYSHAAVVYALKECKYRLLDTAKRYGCEQLLAEAIKESDVSREDIFITTKLWPKDYGFQSSKEALKGSLRRLQTDYVDLLLMHWPEVPSDKTNQRRELLEQTWRALECLYDDGFCKGIGVSNYDTMHLMELFESSTIRPHVNQIEFHPYQNPKKLRAFCESNDIVIQGYCPLGKGKILNDDPIVQIAKEVNKTSAQVLIRWALQNGVSTIPKSTKAYRVRENSDVFDFCLSERHMQILDNLHDGRRYVDPYGIQSRIDSEMPDGYKLHLMREVYMNYAGKQILRFKVPQHLKSWSLDFPGYKPTKFSIDFVGKPWADPEIGDAGFIPKWNAVDGNTDRRSHEGDYTIVDGYPLNPKGRTGICGRGNRGKWGPNHAGDAIVSRWKRDHNNQIIRDQKSNLPILQFVSILRGDTNEWAIPGGMVDVGENVSVTVKREFFEEALNTMNMNESEIDSIQKKLKSFFTTGVEIFRGIVDDPRNTDNAWMETVVYNFHDESGDILKNMNFSAGDDAIGVQWLDVSSTLKLYANHLKFVEKTAKKLNAHFNK